MPRNRGSSATSQIPVKLIWEIQGVFSVPILNNTFILKAVWSNAPGYLFFCVVEYSKWFIVCSECPILPPFPSCTCPRTMCVVFNVPPGFLFRWRTGRSTGISRKQRRRSKSPPPSRTLSKRTRTYWWVCHRMSTHTHTHAHTPQPPAFHGSNKGEVLGNSCGLFLICKPLCIQMPFLCLCAKKCDLSIVYF